MAGRSFEPSTAVLTGATSGIGEHVARDLAEVVDLLVVHGPERESEVQDLLEGLRGQRAVVHYAQADFAELDQVRATADRIGKVADRIDLLINNAGVPGLPDRVVTVDENEKTLQVNCLATALLTELLRPRLRGGNRIVNVGSGRHRYESLDLEDPQFSRGYDQTSAYYRSKFAVVASPLRPAERLRPEGIDVITACPGLTDTSLIETMFGRMGAPVEEGAQNILDAALAPFPTGTCVQGGEVQVPSAEARGPRIQRAVMSLAQDALSRSSLDQHGSP